MMEKFPKIEIEPPNGDYRYHPWPKDLLSSLEEKKLVIPSEMMPVVGMEEIPGVDGKPYLVKNEAMFTAYKHSRAEFSEFFIALRDQCKILGNRCHECGQIICPPFEKRCPQCNFVEMRTEEMSDIGIMAASPVIAFFAPAHFKNQVPYSDGYVFIEDNKRLEADTAMFVRVRTTQGMIRPGIFQKNTEVKIVFKNERNGDMPDIFAVPQSELTPEQILKSPLMESDLSWDAPCEPHFGEPTKKFIEDYEKVIQQFKDLSERIKKSPRAQKDLANWKRKIWIKTAGGELALSIDNGKLELVECVRFIPDLILAVEDPAVFLRWLEGGSALTNAVMEGTLWVSKPELETITRLDRLPRSLRRDNC